MASRQLWRTFNALLVPGLMLPLQLFLLLILCYTLFDVGELVVDESDGRYHFTIDDVSPGNVVQFTFFIAVIHVFLMGQK